MRTWMFTYENIPDLRCILYATPLSCAAPCLSYTSTTPYSAKLHTPKLPFPTLLAYATTFITTLHLLINASPNRATLYPSELRCTTSRNEMMNDNLMRKYP